MTKETKAKRRQNKTRRKKKAGLDIGLRHILIGAGLLLTTLLVTTYALTEVSEKAKFITVNALSIFVLVAIAIQALIYRQQREVMEKAADYTKIGERAYIGIKAVGLFSFIDGQKPSVGIVFLNGGRTPAWNVSVGIRFSIGTKFPTEPPEIQIDSNILPAGVTQERRVEVPGPLTPLTLKELLEGKVKLFLRGKVLFTDAWNNRRPFYFNLVYTPEQNAFQNYNEDRAKKQITPPASEPSPKVDP